MKTSEFRQYLKSKWAFTEDENGFLINGVAIVYKNNSQLHLLVPLDLDGGGRELFDKIVEYTKTPLEEREDIILYMLKTPPPFSSKSKYLIFDLNTYKYYFSSSVACGLSPKASFTQEEINDMPFDTNFLIKEEVK